MNDILLSIIIPIYNRAHIVERLYNSVCSFDFDDVEIIIVDDGSTDETYKLLTEVFKFKYAKLIIEQQENKGPGGARNTGLLKSAGKYIWFVDSDDGINKEAYWELKRIEQSSCSPDFIDFNFHTKGEITSTILFDKGFYEIDNRKGLSLKKQFGRLVCKIFNRSLWIENGIFYPENCLYEDNYLIFKLPFYIKTFYKSDVCAYLHIEDVVSVTRTTTFSNRMYGRTLTAYYGFKKICEMPKSQEDIDIFWEKFITLFLYTTSYMLLMGIKKLNFKGIDKAKMLFDVYRNELKNLEQFAAPYLLKKIETPVKLKPFFSIYRILPNSGKRIDYLDKLNEEAWGRKIWFN